ncbi:YjgF-like protein [Lentinus tigrinus ALCF2SS1-6]|uniref:YjgF-like protein n=1 Tax=Lentinus tigrinus ALCF2SS1-6 TaxID=1328759 RepID=A0A5C2STA7_9APHY|nr:YjgF-like protein [Lentinus tigrinus ALCF2SS1-6]
MQSSSRLLSGSLSRLSASTARTLLTRRVIPAFSQHAHARTRTMSSVTTHPSLSLVSTASAPAAVGPYTQAIRVGDLLFCSGSLGLDPSTGKLVEGGVEAQARQALKNMKAIIEAGGSEVGKVVKTTVFLHSMDDFKPVNAIYAEFFGDHKPARSAVQVARLPLDTLFEIEAIVSLV